LGKRRPKGIDAGESKGFRVKKIFRAVSVALAGLVIGGLGAVPARAAAPTTDQTWLGQIERQNNQYFYGGRACPEQTQICYDIVAQYRIVALNPGAARAVRRLAGGQARLHGRLAPGRNGPSGTLFVRKAERPKPAARTVQADEQSNGQTVTLSPGDHLQVVLHSTYWQFNAPSDPGVVSADSEPAYQGGGPKCGGPPGSGCGTVTAHYTAGHDGSAVVSAGRTSCGEALRCSPDQSRWALTVKVAG
jgi:hypothetical protein